MSSLPPIQFGGLASGLDTQAIVSSLVAAASRPRTLLLQRKALNESRLSLLKDVTSKLNELETALGDLSSASTTIRKTATVADGVGFRVTATGAAAEGTHTLRVDALAQTGREISQGFADADQAGAGSGQLTVTVAGVATQVEILDGLDTLEGIRDAINASGADVTASVVNTGVGTEPFQLVVTGNRTGAIQTVDVDASGLSGGAGLTMNELRAASDAAFEVDGLAMQRSDNTVSDVLDGVSLELEQALAVESSFSIGVDVEATREPIQGFVDQFNNLLSTINDQFVPSENGPSKPLAGDFALRTIQRRLLGSLTESFGRPGNELQTLSAIGIKLSQDGLRLELDTAKLDSAIADRPQEVMDLFVKDAVGPDASVRVRAAGAAPVGAYDVDIAQAPVRAEIQGNQAIRAQGLSKDEDLTFTYLGADTVVSLSQDQTIDDVVNTISTQLAASGVPVHAENAGGVLVLKANDVGSVGTFTVVSSEKGDTNKQTGIGQSPITATGEDVVGTIAGTAATGVGNRLTSDLSGPTPGLVLEVFGSQTGARGAVSVFGGFGEALAGLAEELADPFEGLITRREQGIEGEIGRLDDQILRQDDRLESLELRLTREMTTLETTMGNLNSQLGFLIAALPQSS